MHTKGKWAINGGTNKKGDLFVWKAGEYYGGHAIATVHGEIEEGAEANAKLIAAAPEMADASKDFLDGWLHFCDCIDFEKSNLDADAVRFMNEVPGKIQTAFRAATK